MKTKVGQYVPRIKHDNFPGSQRLSDFQTFLYKEIQSKRYVSTFLNTQKTLCLRGPTFPSQLTRDLSLICLLNTSATDFIKASDEFNSTVAIGIRTLLKHTFTAVFLKKDALKLVESGS